MGITRDLRIYSNCTVHCWSCPFIEVFREDRLAIQDLFNNSTATMMQRVEATANGFACVCCLSVVGPICCSSLTVISFKRKYISISL